MLASESRRDWPLLKRIEDRISFRTISKPSNQVGSPRVQCYLRRSEEILQNDIHSPRHLSHQEVFPHLVHYRRITLIPPLRFGQPEALRRRPGRCGVSSMRICYWRSEGARTSALDKRRGYCWSCALCEH